MLAVLALVTALVAPGLSRAIGRDSERRRMVELVSAFADERVDAMRTLRGRSIYLEAGVDSLRLVRLDDGLEVGAWPEFKLTLAGIEGADDVRTVSFDGSGRTRTREMWFETAGRSGPVRTWSIEFDPISGAPALRARKEQGR